MKANEAPEKIHISIVPNSLNSYTYITCSKDFPNAVEYIRTDAFIEKAYEWFEKNWSCYINTYPSSLAFDAFKNYMKGE